MSRHYRGDLKKDGGGKGNWGRDGDEVEELAGIAIGQEMDDRTINRALNGSGSSTAKAQANKVQFCTESAAMATNTGDGGVDGTGRRNPLGAGWLRRSDADTGRTSDLDSRLLPVTHQP